MSLAAELDKIPSGDRKVSRSFRLHPEVIRMVVELSERFNQSQTVVVETVIRQGYRAIKQGDTDVDTPSA